MPPRPFMIGILLVLGVVIAWHLGDFRGYERGLLEGASQADIVAEAAAASSSSADVDGGELDTVRRERDLAQATVVALRDELAGIDTLSAEDRAELDLYRRIGRDDAPTGLGIDALARVSGAPPALRITLVQARGRSRTGGRLLLSVPPPESDEAGGVDTASPILKKGVAARFEDGRKTWEAPFDLRFFQTVDLLLVGWDGALPPLMRVDVIPTIGPHKAFREFVNSAALTILD